MSSYSQQVPDGLKPQHHSERPGGEESDRPKRYIITQISEEEITRMSSMYSMTRISQEERWMSIGLPRRDRQFVTFTTDEDTGMYLLTVRDHKDNLVTRNGNKKGTSERIYTLYSTTKAVVIPTTEETARLVTQEREWRVTRKCRGSHQ